MLKIEKKFPNYRIKDSLYKEFINSLSHIKKYEPKIHVLKDQQIFLDIKNVSKGILNDYISKILSHTKNKDEGIAVIDIPYREEASAEEDEFWGVILLMGITSNIFSPIIEQVNSTPFTIYTASAENEKNLTDAGLNYFSPDEKLGFHNDGVIKKSNQIFIPHHIVVYNLFFTYRKPGSFHWVPFTLWQEKEKFIEALGVKKRFKFKLTPIVYPTKKGTLEVAGLQKIEAPIFIKNDNEITPFLNGEIIDTADGNPINHILIKELRDSLNNNPFRFKIPQKMRRAIFLKNDFGFHARDIFEEPMVQSKYTRAFLRAVDSDGIDIPSK